jgi:hopanoid biosynthesis associated RND transporter like protein HpnN
MEAADTMRTEREPEPAVAARWLAGLASLGFRYPWTVLTITALTCAVSLWYTGIKLTYEIHRNDLIGKNRDYYQRWEQYVHEFGDDDDMVVVVRGTDRPQLIAALEELAAEVGRQPELFDRLFYKADLRSLRNRALLFLPTEQIRQIQDQLQGMSLLLEPPVLGGLDPLYGWRSLTLYQLLDEGRRKAQGWKAGQDNPEADAFFRQLAGICRIAGDHLHDPERYHNPWRSILPEQPGAQTDLLAEPQYFFSSDGTLASLLVRPVKEKDSFTYSQKSIAALRELLQQLRTKFPGLSFGLTGLPVLENDEMVASQNDSNFASWLALAGVALLYFVVYRGFRYPLMTVTALLVGTAWALGWLTLTVGHLNILSSAFAVMLIGMGDYGVLWVTRFGQERLAGAASGLASRTTALHVGPSILTAAVATALSFYAAMLADLKAVAELGWIAGSGVILCALSCFVVMPAMLALFDFRPKPKAGDAAPVLSLEDHRAARRQWLPALMRRPYWVVGVSGLVTLALACCALQITYDHNLLNLQSPQMESVQWERTLIDHTAGMSWHALSYTTTPEEALALKARYEQLPGVSRVVELASLVPREQDRKRELLADIQRRLKPLPPRGTVIEHEPPKLAAVQGMAGRLLDTLAALERAGASPATRELRQVVEDLLARLREATLARGTDEVRLRLKAFEEYMTRDLAEDLHQLRDVSTPAPIRLDDLPLCLRERYIGKSGKWLLRIFSKDCLWEFEPLASFVAQVRTVDPEATGKPFTTLEGLRAMRNGFLWAGLYAFIAMVLVLVFDFGSVKHTLVALLPLAMGMIATLGIMYLVGATLNPANMIALPLILGVGADNGVHVLHDYRERDRKRRYMLSRTTGRGIMVAALTTILGFGTLMIAQHRGMAGLGLALTLGVTCCMGTALVFLPALLGIVSEKRRKGLIAERTKDAA